MPNFRVKYDCANCGPDGSIYWDGSFYWDEETQSFKAGDGPDGKPMCGNCGGENCHRILDLETGQELRENIFRGWSREKYVTPERFEQLAAEHRAEAEKRRTERQANASIEETAAILAAAYEAQEQSAGADQ